MAGYSLLFFARDAHNPHWWDELTPEIAAETAARAKLAGCKPDADSEVRHGQATTWRGPDVGSVIFNLKRAEGASRGARTRMDDRTIEALASGEPDPHEVARAGEWLQIGGVTRDGHGRGHIEVRVSTGGTGWEWRTLTENDKMTLIALWNEHRQ